MEPPTVSTVSTVPGQSGGGLDLQIKLHDIGDYTEVNDFRSIISGSFVAINMALALGRMGALKSVTFNSYFDIFGLEGILANTSLAVLVIQVARWVYTRFYAAGGRPWSPLVFFAIVASVQTVHDLIFFYGAVNILPSGINEMIDALKAYAKENGSRAVGGHAIFIVVASLFAMLTKDISFLNQFLIVTLTFYLLPFIISIIAPKNRAQAQAPAPPPAPKEEGRPQGGAGPLAGPTVLSPKKEGFRMYGANGMLI
jgi:hypothetical protein